MKLPSLVHILFLMGFAFSALPAHSLPAERPSPSASHESLSSQSGAPTLPKDLDMPESSGAKQPDAFHSPRPVRLGIPYMAFSNSESALLSDTVSWLMQQFGGQLEISAYTEKELKEALRKGKVDLFIASAGFHRELSENGSKDLATLADDERPNPNQSSAGTVIVRRDRLGLKQLGDLKGCSVSAPFPDFYAGWHPVLLEIKKSGHSPDHFFGKALFTGQPMSSVVDNVLSGKTDAGVLPACYLEILQRTKYPGIENIHVIEPKEDALSCLHTTRSYPGMTVATMPSANPETTRAVTRELFTLPPSGSKNTRWSVATDFNGTDELLKSLALGPYQYLRHWTLSRLWNEYWYGAVFIGALVLGCLIHIVRTEKVVRKRTLQLHEALEEQKKMEAEAREKSAQIELLEREGIFQQFSSMLAHELRQPMTAIGLFTKGLISRIQKGKIVKEDVLSILEKIRDLNQQSSNAVDHVRGHAKEKPIRELQDVSGLIRNALNLLLTARYQNLRPCITLDLQEGVSLATDEFEIQLLINNLVKNALEACEGVSDPKILISMRPFENDLGASGIMLKVSDNGPALTEEEISGIGRPFGTTKKDGLGLGASIVRRIAESYGGRLRYYHNHPQGLTAEITLFNPSGEM